MSTSYKQNTRQSTAPIDKRFTEETALIGYGYVKDVNISTGNVELEGTISVEMKNSKNITSLVYPMVYHNRIVPLLGEMVPIYSKGVVGKYFYGSPVNIHNFPTHNAPTNAIAQTPNYNEPTTVNPYKIFTGDVLFEGRFGQSLRFTQTIPSSKTPWSAGKEQGNSVVILSSGQEPTKDGSALLSENIDKDPAILILLENGKMKYEGSTDYEGNQAVLVSDRIHLSAREESVDITAKEDISLQDANWKTTLTEIVNLMEILIEGGNIVPNGLTGVNAQAKAKLIEIKSRIANGI